MRLIPLVRAALSSIILALPAVFWIDTLYAQNIVAPTAAGFTANPVKLTDKDVSEFSRLNPRFTNSAALAEARRIATRLDAHVREFLEGTPWQPFLHTLGISGHEVYFDHPGEMFYALAIALPCLPETTRAQVKDFLRETLVAAPPYAIDGFDRLSGRAREAYDVPEALRLRGRGRAASAFGVYAFWRYCHEAGDVAAAKAHWKQVCLRMKPLLEGGYPFDPRATDSGAGAAQKLNGDLAGLLGLLRLAEWTADPATAGAARARVHLLLEHRVNLERVNPHILERSTASTKSLHNHRLSRYCDLVPETGEALARWSDDCGARNLGAFRQERNGWFLAFGDRLIGGENYTNPLHFPRSLFAGAALIEKLPADQLPGFIDVPWCPGDFYFIEKCAYALWAASGRPWPQP